VVVDDEPSFDRALWDEMVGLGWTSMHVPAAHGGSDAGYGELAVVLHELGRTIVPSPFLASAVLATGVLMCSDNEALSSELLSALVTGTSIGSVAFASIDGSYDVARLTTAWERADATVRLQGTSGFVLDADVADVLVVGTRGADGMPAVVAVDCAASGVQIERAASVDPTRRLFTVDFADVVVAEDRMLCDPGPRAEELLEQLVCIGTIAAACDATGVTEQMLERTAEYAKDRMQFGKPIGSFQAVKHHCANIAIAVETSRAAVRAASEALNGDPSAWPTTAAVVSSYVGPACTEACGFGLRVHGGIGFTWEHDSHLYLKRAMLDEVLFGTPSWHRRRLARTVIESVQEEELQTS
jgi:alkylation response protein AidB-like acyl-CoA dehydrogenase